MIYYRCGGGGISAAKYQKAVDAIVKSNANGAVAHFEDGADGFPVVEMISQITAIQEGTGDPSPSNVRNLVGFTGMKIGNCSDEFAQLWNIDSKFRGVYNWNQKVKNGNFVNTNEWNAATGTFTVANNIGTYSVTSNGDNFCQTLLNMTIGHKYLCMFDVQAENNFKSKTIAYFYFGGALNNTRFFVENDQWKKCSVIIQCVSNQYNMFRLQNSTGNTTNNYKNVVCYDLTQMFGDTIADYIYNLEQTTEGAGVAFFKSLFPDDYYSYNAGVERIVGQLIASVSWQTSAGIVYGGYLNLTTGVLTVTHGIITFDGSGDEIWNDGTIRYSIEIPDCKRTAGRLEVLCNRGEFSSFGGSEGTVFVNNTFFYYYQPTSITSLADFKSWLGSNNLVVVYELATPQTYNLTPIEILSFLGVNNIYSTTGDSSVEYRADGELYVDTHGINDVLNAGVISTPSSYATATFDDISDYDYIIVQLFESESTKPNRVYFFAVADIPENSSLSVTMITEYNTNVACALTRNSIGATFYGGSYKYIYANIIGVKGELF